MEMTDCVWSLQWRQRQWEYEIIVQTLSQKSTLQDLPNFSFADVPLPEEEKPQNILGTMLRYGSYMALTSGMCIVQTLKWYFSKLSDEKIEIYLVCVLRTTCEALAVWSPLIQPGAAQSPSKLTLYWVCHIFPATEKISEENLTSEVPQWA